MINFDATTPQLKVVKQWLEAYTSRDVDKVAPFVSKNFKFQTFPKTIDIPEEAQGVHFQRYRVLLGALTKLEGTIHEAIEAPGKVVIHISAVGSTILGTTHEYDSVCIISLVEEDGELKVLECKDFSDPEKRGTFLGGVAKAVAKLVPGL